MKAVVYTEYGSPDVLQLRDVEKPVPADNEVLLRVCASSVNAGDWHLLKGEPFLVRLMFGLFKPKNPVLGADVAGQVESVGSNVKHFRPGDEVFGDLSVHRWGGFAEYVCAPESALAPRPAGITFEQAAAVPVAAVTALQGLRDRGHVRPGQKVLINGASGGVGSFAVQIARSYGAEVTGVCSSEKVDMVRSLGADHVIDYTEEDFTRNGRAYDLILDLGAFRSPLEYRRALAADGIYVMVGGATSRMFQTMLLGPLLSKSGGRRLVSMLVNPNRDDLLFVSELLESGKLKPAIDRTYPLSGVAEAIRYVEAGRACGKVVISMGPCD